MESASDAYDDLPYDHPQHRLVIFYRSPVLALIQGKSESPPDVINTNDGQWVVFDYRHRQIWVQAV